MNAAVDAGGGHAVDDGDDDYDGGDHLDHGA